MTDKEIVDLIIAGNEEAMLYLLYDRYENDLKFYAWRYYDTLAYLDDLTNYLYIQFKGKKGDWQPLKSFQWKCKFRTWFCSVASHLFLEKRGELIGPGGKDDSIVVGGEDEPLPEPEPDPENPNLVMLMEAINRLEKDDYRFILIKELEGYNHKEIAQMMVAKRKKENKVTFYNGKIVVPDARYVDMNKAKALKEVKAIVEQIKKEWYENK
ncbi:MAG: sigma-70 family RNA polymerase sigma factor [Bacteroidaceae bacterium]|nr:sigma-70 family RNA polymerase sigma factor [Bacteroidaceae bacterium]